MPLSKRAQARREVDLDSMRKRWKSRYQPKAKRDNPRCLTLPDLAQGCRIAKQLTTNLRLIEALEEAAKYFDGAAEGI